MGKYIVGAVIIILIIGGGYYLLAGKKGGTGASGGGSVITVTATSTYATSTFSIVYPSDYSVDESYTYTQVNPKKPISGVKFTIPGEVATGTNLSADTYISVEWLPHAKKCTGDIYLAANVRPQTVAGANGVEYSVATSSDAAAGNIYDEAVYALSGSSPCRAVRYSIHSTEIGNYTPGAVQPFDRSALLSAFDTIRQSLSLTH